MALKSWWPTCFFLFFLLAVAVLSGLPPGGDAWLMPPPLATIGKPQAAATRPKLAVTNQTGQLQRQIDRT